MAILAGICGIETNNQRATSLRLPVACGCNQISRDKAVEVESNKRFIGRGWILLVPALDAQQRDLLPAPSHPMAVQAIGFRIAGLIVIQRKVRR